MKSFESLLRDWKAYRAQPCVDVDLMHNRAAGNDPFYAQLTLEFYRYARRPHRKFPLIRRFGHGVAMCVLPSTFDEYFMRIEAAARRNFKKSQRNGFAFGKIQYNDYLSDVSRIRKSADYRQGKMPADFLNTPVRPVQDPPAKTNIHDYPYFGVLRDGSLYAYAGCFVAGEACMIEHIYGDAAFQADGIVPMLIISVAEHLLAHYPAVKYYGYGTYFGAREEMRRFKRKFCFIPHRVRWRLGGTASLGAPMPPPSLATRVGSTSAGQIEAIAGTRESGNDNACIWR